jgi:hypothetical protein
MITVRKSEERGHVDKGWLDSHHTFSFGAYKDPAHNGFRSLRVINDDRVDAGRGFGAHAHRDMEILSYVLDGKLAHKDSMGNIQKLGPNEIQKMSAGSGVIHSEFNGSEEEPVHFLQIWIEPEAPGGSPGYEQVAFEPEEKQNKLRLLASPNDTSGAVRIKQDAKVFVAALARGTELNYPLAPQRAVWLHVVSGTVVVNGTTLSDGDGAAIQDEAKAQLIAGPATDAEVLLFDLA